MHVVAIWQKKYIGKIVAILQDYYNLSTCFLMGILWKMVLTTFSFFFQLTCNGRTRRLVIANQVRKFYIHLIYPFYVYNYILYLSDYRQLSDGQLRHLCIKFWFALLF